MLKARLGDVGTVWLCIAALGLGSSGGAAAQTSNGRGARDPLQATMIVGSEGKGLFVGAGIPEGNTPIFAAQNGDVPPGIEPLPHDIFTTTDFYQDRDLWSDRALLPLQLARGSRADLGGVRSAADRRRPAALGGVGLLRPRLPARRRS